MSKRIPRFLVPDEMDGLYHVVSRVVGKATVIGRAEFVRRVTGGSAVASDPTAGKPGKMMRFGEWGGLHVLRDLRVNVVG